MDTLRRLVGRLNSLIEGTGLVLLMAMVLIVCWQVFSRRVLGITPPWAEETTILLMIWVGFLGIAVGFGAGSHIALHVFANRLNPSGQLLLGRVISAVTFLFGGYMVVEGARLVALLGSATLAATQLPVAATYIVAPVSGVLICAYAVLNFMGAAEEAGTTEDGSGASCRRGIS